MTNVIITASSSEIFDGLYDCILSYWAPALVIWSTFYAVKICVSVFKRVSRG